MNPQPANNNFGIILAAIIIAATHWFATNNNKPNPIPPGPGPGPTPIVVDDAEETARQCIINYALGIAEAREQAAKALHDGESFEDINKLETAAYIKAREDAFRPDWAVINRYTTEDTRHQAADVKRKQARGVRKAVGK